MKKILQKSYAWLVMLVAMFAMSTSAMAEDGFTEIQFSGIVEVTGGNGNPFTPVEKSGVTISGTGWNSTINIYEGHALTISCPEVNIRRIELYNYSGGLVNQGALTSAEGSYSGGVWEGTSHQVVIGGNDDFFVYNISVYIEGGIGGTGGEEPLGDPDAEFTFNRGGIEPQNGVAVAYYYWSKNSCANPYTGNPMTFTSSTQNIVKIELNGNSLNLINSNSGFTTHSSSKIVWEGDAVEVVFTSNDADGGCVTSAKVWLASTGGSETDNVPVTPSAPVYNAVKVQNAEAGKVYTLTMFNYSQQEYPLALNNGKVVPTQSGTPILFKCGDNGDGLFFITADNKYLRNPHPLGNWVYNHNEGGLTTVYDAELVPLSFEAVPASSSYVTANYAANQGCVAIRQARGYDGSTGPLLMGYTTFSNTGGYSGSGSIYYNNASTSAFILREIQGFPTSALGQDGEDYYGTYYANHAWKIPAGYTAYVVTAADNEGITLEEVTGNIVGANTAVILKGERNANISIDFSLEEGYTNNDNMLRGCVEDFNNIHEEGYVYYVMTYNQSGENLGFYWQNGSGDGSTVNCAAHKAYLRVPVAAASNARGFAFRFQDTTTDIQSANADAADNVIFNLQGQRVNAAAMPGVYVKNGRKFIVK